MANYHITMVRGDTLSFGLEFSGLDKDLDSAFFTVKENPDERIVFEKRLGSGITKAEENQYVVRVAPEDTKALEPKNYHFDLEITVNGDVFTIMKGILELEHDVTF